MAVSGTGSLVLGRVFDRAGIGVLIPLTVVTAAYAPLVFLGGFWAILAGSALWGLGMGVQESLIPAAVAPMVAPGRRSSAYGLFTGIYGTAWVAGSVVIGVLVTVSVGGLVAFCMACELAAIPLIWAVRARTRPGRPAARRPGWPARVSRSPSASVHGPQGCPRPAPQPARAAQAGCPKCLVRGLYAAEHRIYAHKRVRRRGLPSTAVTANGPYLSWWTGGGRMLMLDRDLAAAGPPGTVPQCRYCRAERETEPAGDATNAAWLAHLYLCRGLSTYAIGAVAGLDRQRVTRVLRKAEVPLRPRGAGRLRPLRRDDPPGLPRLLAGLYETGRLGSPQIAAITGMPERTVRDRLRRYGITVRTRGGWNREDRRTVPAEVLDDLYTRLGLTADEVGRRLGTSRNTVLRSAHALGVPVRARGAVPVQGPEEIELVRALYADPLVAAVLDARDVPRVPPGAPLWQRFPDPVPLTAPLVKDLYWGCGAGLAHIELLTGQPAMTVGKFMRRASIAAPAPPRRADPVPAPLGRASRQAAKPSRSKPAGPEDRACGSPQPCLLLWLARDKTGVMLNGDIRCYRTAGRAGRGGAAARPGGDGQPGAVGGDRVRHHLVHARHVPDPPAEQRRDPHRAAGGVLLRRPGPDHRRCHGVLPRQPVRRGRVRHLRPVLGDVRRLRDSVRLQRPRRAAQRRDQPVPRGFAATTLYLAVASLRTDLVLTVIIWLIFACWSCCRSAPGPTRSTSPRPAAGSSWPSRCWPGTTPPATSSSPPSAARSSPSAHRP